MTTFIKPHGGRLNDLYLPAEQAALQRRQAGEYPSRDLTQRQLCDVELLLNGAFSPLDGFLGQADYEQVLQEMRLRDGTLWPMPITLDVPVGFAETIGVGSRVALRDLEGVLIAVLEVSDIWQPDRKAEAVAVFGTDDDDHPGVFYLLHKTHPVYLGGRLLGVEAPIHYDFKYLRDTPQELREKFQKWGWRRVVAFQTRNPMHRSHEYLAKIAIETMDGVLVHSLLGALKPGDIPAEVRSEAISVLVDNYFAPNTVIQAGYPLDMRYAGPREALLHALFRQNYGCSHLIVGRDHAGVGDYYGPFDAQKIFDEIPKDALETKNMNIDWTFWCNKCGGMASQRTCPHTKDDRILLSGTKVRSMLSEGQDLPVEFSRPEVAKVLQKYYAGLTAEQNVKIELKGHSAA